VRPQAYASCARKRFRKISSFARSKLLQHCKSRCKIYFLRCMKKANNAGKNCFVFSGELKNGSLINVLSGGNPGKGIFRCVLVFFGASFITCAKSGADQAINMKCHQLPACCCGPIELNLVFICGSRQPAPDLCKYFALQMTLCIPTRRTQPLLRNCYLYTPFCGSPSVYTCTRWLLEGA
jgi:hypothetical protein